MKIKLAHRSILPGITALAIALGVAARTGAAGFTTAFTYQVRLTESGGPANGIYDLTFALFDAASGGSQVGVTLTNLAATATNSLITLPLDFGASAFGDGDRWLQIGVRTNGSGGAFALFSPRQALTPTPYALVAASANALNIDSTNKVANLNSDLLDGLDSSAFWKLGGNSGTSPGANFIGTTDNQALEIKVNNRTALRIEPDAQSPNLIGGYLGINGNRVIPGSFGATIGGGGGTNGYDRNEAATFATVGGGVQNYAPGAESVVAGGYNNLANNQFTAVGGGWDNQAHGVGSVVAGGNAHRTYGDFSSILGGQNNTVNAGAVNGTIGGGVSNSISSAHAVVAGGATNVIQSSSTWSCIGGGEVNNIQSGSPDCVIAGGQHNTIQSSSWNSAIVGGADNSIQASAPAAFIGGGRANLIWSVRSFVGGGATNSIGPNSDYSVIVGGLKNTNTGQYAFIGGGQNNVVNAGANHAAVGSGVNNSVSSASAVVAGGSNNVIQASARWSFIGGGNANVINNSFEGGGGSGNYSTIGGGLNNLVGAHDATIAGGNQNRAGGAQSTVAGGYNNFASGIGSAIGGGWNHQAGTYATVPGGLNNVAGGDYSFAAGRRAKANHTGSFVWADATEADLATTATNQFLIRASGGVGIGTNNPAGAALNVNGTVTATSFSGNGSGLTSVSAGQLTGTLPSAQLSGTYSGAVTFSNTANSFTGNGTGLTNVNAVTLGGLSSSSLWQLGGNTLSSGQFLGSTNNQPVTIKVNGIQALQISPTINDSNHSNIVNIVGGSPVNFIAPGVYGAVIAGGGAQGIGGFSFTNSVSADFGVIGGGYANTIQSGAVDSMIGGGFQNTIQTNAYVSTISGGDHNTIQTNAVVSTISGGSGNTIQPNASASTIGGGDYNTIQDFAEHSTIGGGSGNTIQNSAVYSTIAGGGANTIKTNAIVSTISGGDQNTIQANAARSTIGGGLQNTIQPNALVSTIGGGRSNTTSGTYASVPGGDQNVAGTNSFAAGHRAKATHTGSFVWADSTDADLATTAEKQFLIRASGGVGIGTNNPQSALHVVGTVTATAFNPPSDRNLKENFAPVNPRGVLDKVVALPISRWNFKGDSATPHLGPMAQDFHAAFGVGTDERHISTVDADGVALAAIQGLHQIVKERDTEIEALKRSVAELRAAVNALAEKSGPATR